jgi:hypothetical protein
MVKLLRLKGDTTQGEQSKSEIRNTFREPIFVKANSKIALAGLDVAFRDSANETFIVSDAISGLYLQLNNPAGSRDLIELTPGTYTQMGLLDELAIQARCYGGNGGDDVGTNIIVTNSGRTSRIIQNTYDIDDAGFNGFRWQSVNAPTVTASTYTGKVGVADSTRNFSTVPNAGCQLRCVMNTDATEITLGVANTSNSLAWGLKVNNFGEYVAVFNDAEAASTGVLAATDDVISISRIADQITISVVDPGTGLDRFPPEEFTLTPTIWEAYLDKDPAWYISTPVGSVGSIREVILTQRFDTLGSSKGIGGNLTLEFLGIVMARYFGYPSLGPFEILAGDPAVLTSPQYMQGDRNFRGLMVNIDPFQIESYDGAADSQTRPNCLYVIHDLTSLDNEVNLDVPNLIKMSLRNENDMTLNQIRITFRTSLDNTALQFSNNPIVTLLIFDPNE